MKKYSMFMWAITVLLSVFIGLYAGHQISRAISDIKIMDLQVQLETANAALADANIELAFWKSTIRGLAEGEQLTGSLMKERVSDGD